jgi:hypothetical protein
MAEPIRLRFLRRSPVLSLISLVLVFIELCLLQGLSFTKIMSVTAIIKSDPPMQRLLKQIELPASSNSRARVLMKYRFSSSHVSVQPGKAN